ncbi:MAG: hypothetical protein JKY32_04495 [Rhizobiales bacterium]|nr:hypothetical protein [Hyphomicrobiales bacterium]
MGDRATASIHLPGANDEDAINIVEADAAANRWKTEFATRGRGWIDDTRTHCLSAKNLVLNDASGGPCLIPGRQKMDWKIPSHPAGRKIS